MNNRVTVVYFGLASAISCHKYVRFETFCNPSYIFAARFPLHYTHREKQKERETHRVIGALIERLQREDQELYPLVEE